MVIARKDNKKIIMPYESYKVHYEPYGWTMENLDKEKRNGKQETNVNFNENIQQDRENREIIVERQQNEIDRERSNRNNRRK